MTRTREHGQFVPITAMVMFTVVVALMAVVDIYKISREKLKAQNLADAAALNVASQIASSTNKVADLNQWMNNMVDLGPNVPQTLPGQVPNCKNLNPKLFPPISCAENANKSSSKFMFNAKGDAANYALLVQKINQTQQLFVDTYNNFIGAGSGSNSSVSTRSSLNSILIADIPDLGDPGTIVYVWNTLGGAPSAQSVQLAAAQMSGTTTNSLNTTGMQPLKFKVHDITVTYKNTVTVPVLGTQALPPVAMSMGQLLNNSNSQTVAAVGWMEPDTAGTPQIQVGATGGGKMRIGAGAKVGRVVQIPVLGTKVVWAQAQAYIVNGSGTIGIDNTIDPVHPVFKPTYWIKLVGPN